MYKRQVKSYLRGEYGRAPGEIDPELLTKVLGDEKPYTGRFADTLAPEFEKVKAELGDRAESDEDVLSYIAFPQIAEKFFASREEKRNRTMQYTVERID